MSSSITEFYQGKNILVFGSTTFPGKVLIEKLLRSCSNIEKIYCPIHCSKQTGGCILTFINYKIDHN